MRSDQRLPQCSYRPPPTIQAIQFLLQLSTLCRSERPQCALQLSTLRGLTVLGMPLAPTRPTEADDYGTAKALLVVERVVAGPRALAEVQKNLTPLEVSSCPSADSGLIGGLNG